MTLHGEVCFPNLEFEKQVIDFGCILNDTEVTRYMNIVNNSPMEVRYKWSFLIDGEPISVYHCRPEMRLPTQLSPMLEVEEYEADDEENNIEGEGEMGEQVYVPPVGEGESGDEVSEYPTTQVEVTGAESPRTPRVQENGNMEIEQSVPIAIEKVILCSIF